MLLYSYIGMLEKPKQFNTDESLALIRITSMRVVDPNSVLKN